MSTMTITPQESDELRELYLAGAHSEALARAFGRDVRAVRTALRREGISLRREPPLPVDWQATLPLPARRGLQLYLAQLQAHLTAAWARLDQVALGSTTNTYVFPSSTAYTAALETARPPESSLDVARRLGIDLTIVLLAYAEWAEQQEML